MVAVVDDYWTVGIKHLDAELCRRGGAAGHFRANSETCLWVVIANVSINREVANVLLQHHEHHFGDGEGTSSAFRRPPEEGHSPQVHERLWHDGPLAAETRSSAGHRHYERDLCQHVPPRSRSALRPEWDSATFGDDG